MNIKIRQAELADLEASYQVEIACFPTDEAASRTKIRKRLEEFAEGYLVALVNKTIIGHINSAASHKDDISDEALKAMIGHDANGHNLVIFSVAVLPDYQGQGIASALLKTYIARAKTQNRSNILLLCKQQLIGFYEKIGFMNRGLSASTHGGVTWYEMILSLKQVST